MVLELIVVVGEGVGHRSKPKHQSLYAAINGCHVDTVASAVATVVASVDAKSSDGAAIERVTVTSVAACRTSDTEHEQTATAIIPATVWKPPATTENYGSLEVAVSNTIHALTHPSLQSKKLDERTAKQERRGGTKESKQRIRIGPPAPREGAIQQWITLTSARYTVTTLLISLRICGSSQRAIHVYCPLASGF